MWKNHDRIVREDDGLLIEVTDRLDAIGRPDSNRHFPDARPSADPARKDFPFLPADEDAPQSGVMWEAWAIAFVLAAVCANGIRVLVSLVDTNF